MGRYDYYEVIKDDLKTFIKENYDLNQVLPELLDEMMEEREG